MKHKSKKNTQKFPSAILSGIILTIVCAGPFCNLIYGILTHEYDNILLSAILTFPTLITIGAYWGWYITLNVQDKLENLLRDTENEK